MESKKVRGLYFIGEVPMLPDGLVAITSSGHGLPRSCGAGCVRDFFLLDVSQLYHATFFVSYEMRCSFLTKNRNFTFLYNS